MELLIEGLNIGPHEVKKVQLKPLDRNNTSFGNNNGDSAETINHGVANVMLTNLKESSGIKFILPKKMFPGLYQKTDVAFEDGLKNENEIRDIDMDNSWIKNTNRCRRASSKASKRNKRRITKRNVEKKTSAIKRNQVKNNTMKKIERQRKRVIREKKESKIQRKRNNKKNMKIMNQKLASFQI